MTALFHLLARYVVNTDPTSIVDELLPVAGPVHDLEAEPITGDALVPLLSPAPSGQTRTAGEVLGVLRDTFDILDLGNLLEGAVEERRRELVAQRTRMRNQMEEPESSQPTGWLQGIDDLTPGSFDLLAMTALFSA